MQPRRGGGAAALGRARLVRSDAARLRGQPRRSTCAAGPGLAAGRARPRATSSRPPPSSARRPTRPARSPAAPKHELHQLRELAARFIGPERAEERVPRPDVFPAPPRSSSPSACSPAPSAPPRRVSSSPSARRKALGFPAGCRARSARCWTKRPRRSATTPTCCSRTLDHMGLGLAVFDPDRQAGRLERALCDPDRARVAQSSRGRRQSRDPAGAQVRRWRCRPAAQSRGRPSAN